MAVGAACLLLLLLFRSQPPSAAVMLEPQFWCFAGQDHPTHKAAEERLCAVPSFGAVSEAEQL